jgi:hypothetical protein
MTAPVVVAPTAWRQHRRAGLPGVGLRIVALHLAEYDDLRDLALCMRLSDYVY